MNRAPMPRPGGATSNPELASAISQNPVFAAVAHELEQKREQQAVKWFYVYSVSGSVVGQATNPFNIIIEQGTDFMCHFMTASAFSYDAGNATSFPYPNSAGNTAWAARGLSVQLTDTRSGREHTSGFVPLELLGTPGYGLNFQNPFPFRNLFYRNSKLRLDVRNRDNSNRTHYFEFALIGYKVLTPQ